MPEPIVRNTRCPLCRGDDSQGHVFGSCMHPDINKQYTQQQSKVCIQTFALLYIAAFPCIPNCLGIMDQLITGNYVIKFEKNSFRVQLSARGYSNLLCLGAAEGAGKGR